MFILVYQNCFIEQEAIFIKSSRTDISPRNDNWPMVEQYIILRYNYCSTPRIVDETRPCTTFDQFIILKYNYGITPRIVDETGDCPTFDQFIIL